MTSVEFLQKALRML